MIALTAIKGGALNIPAWRMKAGETGAVFGETGVQTDAFCEMVLGIRPPVEGKVGILDCEDLYAQPEHRRLQLLGRVGYCGRLGNPIHNLTVRENIVLPALFHRGGTANALYLELDRVLDRVQTLTRLSQEELSVWMGQSPAALSVFARNLCGILRARLLVPEVFVFDGILDEQERSARQKLLALAMDSVASRPGACAVFTAVDKASLAALKADQVLNLSSEDTVPEAISPR